MNDHARLLAREVSAHGFETLQARVVRETALKAAA